MGPVSVVWSRDFATWSAYLAALALLPLPFWLIESWQGLSGGAVGLMSLPISMVLSGVVARQPAWAQAPAPSAAQQRPVWAVWVGLCAALLAFNVLSLWSRHGLFAVGLLLPPLLFVWLWGALGWPKAKAMSLPIFFGWFALPWERYIHGVCDPVLQSWTTEIAYRALHWAGYPMIYWDAVTIYTSEFYVIIDESCSGINMLVTLTMYTLLFGWLVQPRLRYRVYLMLLVLPLGMLANGLRVAAIYLMGHYGGEALAMGPWHDRSGFLVFLPAFWFLFVVNQVLVRRDLRQRGA